jgi:Family of unknown function (DUF5317)
MPVPPVAEYASGTLETRTDMKLTLLVIIIALAAGSLAGGRLSDLAAIRLRWPLLAPLGLGLQLLPIGEHVLSMVLLYVSFGLLFVFVCVNIRVPGGALLLLGLALNLSVIAINGGMPVTEHALVASEQQGTLQSLIHDGGAKHHLASPDDALLPLADVIPIGWGIDQVVSVGDVATYLGIMWLIVASMRRRAIVRPRAFGWVRSSRSEGVDVGR